MTNQSLQDRKRAERAANSPNKQLIGIAIGIVAVLVIAALAYFAWPKTPPITALKIDDLVVGTGAEAKEGDTVSVHYTGWLQTKSKSDPFDSSLNSGQPFQFVLGQHGIIAGWNQGVVGMKVGGRRQLTIPPDLGYGAEGAGGVIPPNAVLIFEVELVDIKAPAATLAPTSITALKIEDLVVGTGVEAKAGDTLSMQYTGWLEDGTKFNSSLDSGLSVEFVLGQGGVIAGWDQGLVGMKVGGKRRLTIPPHLGYGAEGYPGLIPPNAALIFEMELLEIK